MGQYGFKCKGCGDVASTCDSEECAEEVYKKTRSTEGKKLGKTFYCWSDSSGEFTNHFCSKKCLPKIRIKKTTGAYGYW